MTDKKILEEDMKTSFQFPELRSEILKELEKRGLKHKCNERYTFPTNETIELAIQKATEYSSFQKRAVEQKTIKKVFDEIKKLDSLGKWGKRYYHEDDLEQLKQKFVKGEGNDNNKKI